MAAATGKVTLMSLAGAFGLCVGSMHAGAACIAKGDETATVAAVEPRLELRLTDGRLLRLVGVEPAAPTPHDRDLGESTRARLAAMIAGHAVSVHLLGGKPDRWGRLAAFAFPADGDGAPGGVATMALAAGLARERAEPTAHGCHDEFVEAETQARSNRRGLWGDAYYRVLAPDDRAAFAERSSTFVIAEGRLTAVDAGPYRTKLKFAMRDGDGRDTLSATILPRTMKAFEEQGVHVQSLIGRTLRMRGLFDMRFGPEIELTGPDALDVLPVPAAAGHGAG